MKTTFIILLLLFISYLVLPQLLQVVVGILFIVVFAGLGLYLMDKIT